ncbi:MAG: hypothetical protein KIT80_00955 [Chitinophagaceae bacterium]|nr:hypothetical protein [Chitinophagaceae bacterium]MCW5925459.1 hypothetical protein [Chitinophagaceae bacterium]
MTFIILLLQLPAPAQQKAENIIIVTTDGLRWQEVFGGMDSSLADNPRFNQGERDLLYKKYGAATAMERRKKLFPFIWQAFASQGQLYGNRAYGNRVNTANPYWFSYPGYNEIFTGFPDTAINTNAYRDNPHVTVLEYLHQLPEFKGRIAAFGSWEAYTRILNKKRAGFPVMASFDSISWEGATEKEQLINALKQESFRAQENEGCMDVFTHFQAMEYMKIRKPKVLYIAYLETDEWAHAGNYKYYLQSAAKVDAWLKDIWNYIQSDPFYKDKTALLITTDHGRGDKVKEKWTSHGGVEGADQVWIGVMGPGIPARGEVKTGMQLYQKQIAQTIALLLNRKYTATHPVADAISQITEP